jgi:hypothetical protein
LKPKCDLISEADIDFLSASSVKILNFTALKRTFEAQKPVPICMMLAGVGWFC